MGSERGDRELEIFCRFAEAAGLLVSDGSAEKRKHPEPDILFKDEGGQLSAFELVELIDQEYSGRIGLLVSTKTALRTYYEYLPSDRRAIFDNKYSNALLYFRFTPNLTFNQRRASFPDMFEKLFSLPDGFAGDALEGDPLLAGRLNGISVARGGFTGPMFDPESIGWVGDPTVLAISRKFEKRYKTACSIELLAYIDVNPMLPDEVWLADLTEFLDARPKPLPFDRIWVFDLKENRVKLNYS